MEFDLGALADLAKPLLPAGFYYKTFIGPGRPNRAWMFYEPFIRRAAGMGKAPAAPDPDRYERMHGHCDVLVVGAGPAGIAAALAAARAGARVVLADEQAEPGGHLLGRTVEIDGRPALDWVASAMTTLSAMPEVKILRRATVEGAYDHLLFGIAERLTDAVPAEGRPRQRYWQMRVRQVVLATGAIERPIAFLDNDRPGIMLASAAAAYALRYGVSPGNRIVVFTNNDWGYRSAIDLRSAGCAVEAVVDLRSAAGPVARMAEAAGLTIRLGAAVVRALGRSLTAVEVAPLGADGARLSGAVERIECDCLAVSGGFTPTVHLFSHARGKLLYDPEIAAFIPGAAPAGFHAAGGCRGSFTLARVLSEGFAAGAAAASAAGFNGGGVPPTPRVAAEEFAPPRFVWRVPANRRGKRWVDLQNDVTDRRTSRSPRAKDYAIVEHQALHHARHGHRPGQDQQPRRPRTSSPSRRPADPARSAHHLPPALHADHASAPSPGRQAGTLVQPIRRTPMHDWHEAHGARFCRTRLVAARRTATRKRGESVHDAIRARRERCARASAWWTSRPSARSTCRAATSWSSSTASISTASPPSRSARAATA